MSKEKTAANPVVGKIVGSPDIHTHIVVAGRTPSLKFPLRCLSNRRHTPKNTRFEIKFLP